MSMPQDDLIRIRVSSPHLAFQPGSRLTCEYDIDDEIFDELQAVETSVMWYSEGKGDEDFGVHFFVRRNRSQLRQDRLSAYHFETDLPLSPQSYEGEILKIRWCVRVKLFSQGGKVTSRDKNFRLGQVGMENQGEYRGASHDRAV